MTKKEAMRQTAQENTLLDLGFTRAEAEALRRISMTLHHWYELECGTDSRCVVRGHKAGGEFTYDDNGAAYMECAGTSGPNRYYRIPDRERGAQKRLAAILKARNDRARLATVNAARTDGAIATAADHAAHTLTTYLQTDPRGAALYIIRPGDVPDGADVQGYYSRGVCVY